MAHVKARAPRKQEFWADDRKQIVHGFTVELPTAEKDDDGKTIDTVYEFKGTATDPMDQSCECSDPEHLALFCAAPNKHYIITGTKEEAKLIADAKAKGEKIAAARVKAMADLQEKYIRDAKNRQIQAKKGKQNATNTFDAGVAA